MKRFTAALVAWGPLGLFILSILDSAGVPVIGGVDFLLVAISVQHPDQTWLAAFCATVGSVVGTLILFAIARKGGEVLLEKHLSRRRGARLHAWFQRYGLVTVFVPALSPLPLPMKIPVFCAGALEVRWSYFTAVLLAARVIRYFSLAYLARKYGHQTFSFLLAHAFVVAGIAIALAVLFGLVIWFIDKYELPERPEPLRPKSHARS